MKPPVAAMLLFATASAAWGQERVFLRADAARVPAGGPVRVHLESAQGPAAWDNDRVRLLFVLGRDTRENMDRAPAAPGAAGGVALPAPAPGSCAVGLDFKPTVEVMDADALRAFALARCDERLPRSVTGKVRVLRTQSCKALLRVGDAPGSAAALAETAQGAEIDVRMDPTRALIGSDVAFEVSVGGKEIEEYRAFATALATGKTQEIEADDDQPGRFRITESGPWRVEFHRLTKVADGGDADWALVSATLTFEVPAEQRP